MNTTHCRRLVRLAFTCLLSGLLGASPAWAAGDAEARAHITQERRAIEATHAERQKQCAGQFIVTSCMEAARSQRREALLALDAREAALDDAERRERALDRQARIDAKVARQASASAPDREPLPLVRADQVSKARAAPAPRGASHAPASRAALSSPEDIKAREAREAEARTRFEQREREARARQEAAAARRRERSLSGKPPAAALPALGSSGTGSP